MEKLSVSGYRLLVNCLVIIDEDFHKIPYSIFHNKLCVCGGGKGKGGLRVDVFGACYAGVWKSMCMCF